MTRMEEIRARLDKATPGLSEIDGGEELAKRRGNPKSRYMWSLFGTYADAILLVNARNDLAYLLGRLARRDQRCEDLAASLDEIRAVLGEDPDPCPEHPDDDPITCGWKRDIITIRNILNDTKEN